MCALFTWRVAKMLLIFCCLDVIFNTISRGTSYEIEQFGADPVLM